MNLSPLNFVGLIARINDSDLARGSKWMAKPEKKKRRKAIQVICWQCPACSDTHEDEDDAEDCCADESSGTAHEEGSSDCPVCGLGYPEPRVAADCCLWKDLDAPTRWRMADAVEAGSTWQTQLGLSS